MAIALFDDEIESLVPREETGFNDYDNETIEITVSNSTAINIPEDDYTKTQPCIQLESGKTFHVFLAHSADDRAQMEDLLDRLEDEPYNLKCCYSARDFIPGQPVMDMMEKCITESQNVLLAMSPSFLESEFCQGERRMAECQQAIDGKNMIIPVLIKPCSLSLNIRATNYIDATVESEAEVLRKIIEAIKHGTTFMSSQEYTIASNPDGVPLDRNGSKIVLNTTSGLKLKIPPFRPFFAELTADEKSTCEAMGLKVPDEDFQKILTLLNEMPLLKNDKISSKGAGRNCMFAAYWPLHITVVMTVIGLAWALARDWDDGDSAAIPFLVIFFGFFLLLLCTFIVLKLQYRKMRRLTQEWTDLISQCLYQTYQLMVAMDLDERRLILIKYDTKLCQNYVRDHLLPNINYGQCQRDEDLDTIADKVIAYAIPGYLKTFLQCSSPATTVRHVTTTKCICLCQYIQREHLHRPIQANLDMYGTASKKETKLIHEVLGYGIGALI